MLFADSVPVAELYVKSAVSVLTVVIVPGDETNTGYFMALVDESSTAVRAFTTNGVPLYVLTSNATLSPALTPDVNVIDALSNGFVIRNASSGTNPSGGTCIYAAFAEIPFKTALAR